MKVWDLATDKEAATLDGFSGPVTSVAFSADSRRLVAASGVDQIVKIWDAPHWNGAAGVRPEPLTLRHPGPVHSVAFSGAHGERVATGSADHVVRLWDVRTGKQALILRGHTAGVFGVAFSPDGRRLASVSDDRTAKLWDVTANHEIQTLPLTTMAAWHVAFDPRGERLAVAGNDRTVRVVSLATGLEVAALHGHAAKVLAVAYSRDGRQLASASEDRTIRLWDAANNGQARVLRGHAGAVRSIAFSADGRRLASASADGTLKLWNVLAGTAECTLRGHAGAVWAVAFSPDGRLLGSAGEEGIVRLWDAAGEMQSAVRGHTGPVLTLAFSPDGQSLATAGEDRTVRVWEAATGRETLMLAGHTAEIWEVAFSGDGRRLAACGGDTVRIWDLTTGQEVLTLRGPATQKFYSVACDPMRRRLAAAGQQTNTVEQTVMIWDATPLTAELLDEREAQSLVAFGFAQRLADQRLSDPWVSGPEATARIRTAVGVRDGVRQRALALVEAYDQARIQREADIVVNRQFVKLHLRSRVVECLTADATLSEPVRRQALALVERFVESSRQLAQASSIVLGRPGAEAAAYASALRLAERACASAPYDGSYQTLVGMGRYRMGKYPEALAAFTQAEALNAAAGAEVAPADLAFLAMTQLRLRQPELALVTRTRLRGDAAAALGHRQ